MPARTHRILLALAAAAALFAAGAPSARAADVPLSTRFAQTLRGDVRSIGNTLESCPGGSACGRARNRTATGTALDNDYDMAYVDVDGDASTFDSSGADLAVPAGATVVWAGLYWGADTSAGQQGSAAADAAQRDRIRFRVPGGAYQTVTSADVASSSLARLRPLSRVRRRDRPGRRRPQRPLLGRQRAGRDRGGPLRRLVADRRVSRRLPGDPARQRARRPGHGGRRAPALGHRRAVLHARDRRGALQPRAGRLRGRRRDHGRHGDVQRRGAQRRAQPRRQRHELDRRGQRVQRGSAKPELREHARARRRLEQLHEPPAQRPEQRVTGHELAERDLLPVRALPGLRRGSGGQHVAAGGVGDGARRLDPDRVQRRLERHAGARLHLPVAAL